MIIFNVFFIKSGFRYGVKSHFTSKVKAPIYLIGADVKVEENTTVSVSNSQRILNGKTQSSGISYVFHV